MGLCCVLASTRWRRFAEQLFADGAREFDSQQLRELVYEQLGGRKQVTGRLQDEVEIRVRLTSAIFDFSLRQAQLRDRASHRRWTPLQG